MYSARGVLCDSELEASLKYLLPPTGLGGLDKAAALVAAAITAQRAIVIVGDFDADGATGVALAVRALRAMGGRRVDYCVPNRFSDGYGLTRALVRHLAKECPDLIVTVDNGISSNNGVAAAREAGMQVVITDHHLPGRELPDADAIVNPNLPGDGFVSKSLAGVGVMLYLLTAVRRKLAEGGMLPQPVRLDDWLDLVALGTVADLVPLDRNNRLLVAQGLGRIRGGRCVAGIRALADVAGRDCRSMTAADLGFAIAPRINAAGRLEDMATGIECLLTDDPDRARALAAQLHQINAQRRALQDEMEAEAAQIVAGLSQQDTWGDRRSLCLCDDRWHQGVVGLVASRIKERWHLPVVAFAPAAPGDEQLKGSARSVSGLHIRDVLANVAACEPDLIERFGGHAMAAGLTLRRDRLERFEQVFEAEVGRVQGDQPGGRVVYTDGALAPPDLCLDLADLLRSGGPWGQGFPEPLFDNAFEVLEARTVGQRHTRLRVQLAGGKPLDAIAFNQPREKLAELGNPLRLLYRLDINEYRGRRDLQLVVNHALALG